MKPKQMKVEPEPSLFLCRGRSLLPIPLTVKRNLPATLPIHVLGACHTCHKHRHLG